MRAPISPALEQISCQGGQVAPDKDPMIQGRASSKAEKAVARRHEAAVEDRQLRGERHRADPELLQSQNGQTRQFAVPERLSVCGHSQNESSVAFLCRFPALPMFDEPRIKWSIVCERTQGERTRYWTVLSHFTTTLINRRPRNTRDTERLWHSPRKSSDD